MILRPLLILLLAAASLCLHAQGIAIGEWRDHYPYNKAIGVANAGDKVYCITEGGMFFYSKSDNSLERISKINGLSDVEYSAIDYNPVSKAVIIVYKNANIDLIGSDGKITNIADIKRASIIGNKTINGIYIKDKYAYLACGFGIVVLDTERKEISETYYIGAGGGLVNVYDITTTATHIFASAQGGVYYAPLNGNLTNSIAWTKFSGFPNGPYNTIASFNGKVYVNYAKILSSAPAWNQDTVYVYSNNMWSKIPSSYGASYWKLRPAGNELMAVRNNDVAFFDTVHVKTNIIYGYTFGWPSPKDASYDAATRMTWIADLRYGLVEALNTWENKNHLTNGPDASLMNRSSGAFRMAAAPNSVCFIPGNITAEWNNTYTFGSYSCFENETWRSVDGDNYPGFMRGDSLIDFVAVEIHPAIPGKVFIGTWGRGLLEFDNYTLTRNYNQYNNSSTLTPRPGNDKWLGVAGLDFDKDNNLWVTNAFVTNGISVKRANGTWQSYSLAPHVSSVTEIGPVMADRLGQKWIILPRGKGMIVFDEKQPSGAQSKKLTTSAGSGALPSPEVLSIAEDKDGEIWLGTDKGIAVIYTPENVFGTGSFDAQQIIIQQDGHYQVLLETEAISAIAVDGANRKWIATQNAGVFLMSPDGTQEIHHFDASNSPLPSNHVTSIVIEPASGEVFIGTEKGVVSYKGTATEGGDNFDGVYAFPNPVKPGFEGTIAIKGLVADAEVKITDIAGNLVYSTRAEGGQATWNGHSLNGDKARSGVYMVFCSDSEGKKTYVTKILIVN